MGLFELVALLLTLAALFSYVNVRFLGLPTTVGVMLIALVLSLALIGLAELGVDMESQARTVLESIDFDRALLHGMLSFLLFAGALHVNIDDLAEHKWIISSLATGGVLVSTFLVGGMSWLLFDAVGVPLDFMYCLLFGALISPTDPIAVLALLKQVGAPRSLETKIAGESLFNDGVGVVVFIVLLTIATGAEDTGVGDVLLLFAKETVGGAAFGFATGYVTYRMLRSVDNYQVEVLLTLALVTGCYALAHALHLSGPIAIVVAGLLIGNQGRRLAMSSRTREHLDTFWELVDGILNAVLFLLIGFEVLVVTRMGYSILAGVLAIPVVLLSRFISVSIPVSLLKLRRRFTPHVIAILTWAGLRGGISVALALSLPHGPERDVILTVTYAVVVFSILVQGMTTGKLVRRATRAEEEEGK